MTKLSARILLCVVVVVVIMIIMCIIDMIIRITFIRILMFIINYNYYYHYYYYYYDFYYCFIISSDVARTRPRPVFVAGRAPPAASAVAPSRAAAAFGQLVCVSS